MSIDNINNISLDYHFDEKDPNIIIPIRLLAWHSRFKKRKEPKKGLSNGLILVA